MKSVEELRITPIPWKAEENRVSRKGTYSICNRGGVVGAKEWNADARMIVAAPALYECLRDAVIEVCHNCTSCGSSVDGYACHADEGRECFAIKWRAAIAAASGESEVKE